MILMLYITDDKIFENLTLTKYGRKINKGSTRVTKSILSIGMTSLRLKNDL